MSGPFWVARSVIRPARNSHQALEVLHTGIMGQRGYWVLEVDIRKYFDSIPFAPLREMSCETSHRWRGQKADRQMAQSRCAGDGQVHYPEAGTPQAV